MQPNLKFGDQSIVDRVVNVGPDSYFVKRFVQRYLDPTSIIVSYEAVSKAAPWVNPASSYMQYRGREVPRERAFIVTSSDPEPVVSDSPSVVPKFTYPGFQSESLLFYRDSRVVGVVDHIFRRLNVDLEIRGVPFVLNHCIATRYRDGDDAMGFRSDNARHLTHRTPTLVISLGGTREFHLRRKSDGAVRAFAAEDGDLFVLGHLTNELYEHSIVPVTKERLIDPHEPIQPQISLAFRDVAAAVTRLSLNRRINPLAAQIMKAFNLIQRDLEPCPKKARTAEE